MISRGQAEEEHLDDGPIADPGHVGLVVVQGLTKALGGLGEALIDVLTTAGLIEATRLENGWARSRSALRRQRLNHRHRWVRVEALTHHPGDLLFDEWRHPTVIAHEGRHINLGRTLGPDRRGPSRERHEGYDAGQQAANDDSPLGMAAGTPQNIRMMSHATLHPHPRTYHPHRRRGQHRASVLTAPRACCHQALARFKKYLVSPVRVVCTATNS